MGRTERDFRALLVDTLDGIREVYATKDIQNDREAYNIVVNSVTFLEDLLHPYMNHDKWTAYHPKQTDDPYQDIHNRIRALIGIGRTVALTPPEEIEEDAEEFYVDDTQSTA